MATVISSEPRDSLAVGVLADATPNLNKAAHGDEKSSELQVWRRRHGHDGIKISLVCNKDFSVMLVPEIP